MANLTIYKTELYNETYRRIFTGVYNDFKENAIRDYKFELEPLSYDDFIKSIKEGLLQCIILFEDDIPTGFLAYTTIISESVELNIIHCIGNENLNHKRRLLLEKFIEINKHLMKEKIVTYPLLGKQAEFAREITDYGFKTVNTAVMSFNLRDDFALNRVKETPVNELEEYFSISDWKGIYLKDTAEVMQQAFKDSSDALFDNRFTTYKGCNDILEKITENIYGQFLPAITKVLLYKRRPVGVCFANLTNDKIANIPVMAILKKYRGNGFSKILLKNLLSDLLNYVVVEDKPLKEINVSCDAENAPAVRMYKSMGFTPDYTYPVAYHSGLN